MTIIREGRSQDLDVTLGEGPREFQDSRRSQGEWMQGAEWDDMENLRIEKTAPEQLSVELRFRDEGGATVDRKYQGSRSDIRRQVQQDAALTPGRRDYVLRNLRRIVQGPGSEVLDRGSDM